MPLIPVFSAPCVAIAYDSQEACLFLTLRGQSGLPALPDTMLTEWGRPPAYPTRCLIQDTIAQPGAGTEVVDWLRDQLLPLLHQAGIWQLTWVCSPTPYGYQLAQQVAHGLPQVGLTFFGDLEHASTWLRQPH